MNQDTIADVEPRTVQAMMVRRNLLWVRYLLLSRVRLTQDSIKALTLKGHEISGEKLKEAFTSSKPPTKWKRLSSIQKCLLSGQYFDMLMHQHADIPAAITIRVPVGMPKTAENRKFVYRRVKELLSHLTHDKELISLYWEDRVEGSNHGKYDTLHAHGIVLLAPNTSVDAAIQQAKEALKQRGWYFHVQFSYNAFSWLGYALKGHYTPNSRPSFFYLSPELIVRLRDSFLVQIASSSKIPKTNIEDEISRYRELDLVS